MIKIRLTYDKNNKKELEDAIKKIEESFIILNKSRVYEGRGSSSYNNIYLDIEVKKLGNYIKKEKLKDTTVIIKDYVKADVYDGELYIQHVYIDERNNEYKSNPYRIDLINDDVADDILCMLDIPKDELDIIDNDELNDIVNTYFNSLLPSLLVKGVFLNEINECLFKKAKREARKYKKSSMK